MGVILAQTVSHNAGAFAVWLVRGQAQLMHGEEDAPLNGLQAVLHPGQGPLQDDMLRIGHHAFGHHLFQ